MSAARADVVVLGAGLTGLSAALELDRAGAPFRLLERAGRVGGHAVTDAEEGFRFDRTGHLLHLRDPALREEVVGWLGGECDAIERRSRVYSHGAYTRYPFQANTFGLPPAVAYECVLGFLRAREAPPGPEPETFEGHCLRAFGEGFARHFFLPYNEKMWGVPPRELTADWCGRFVPRPSLEDVVAGAVGLNDRELGYNASFLYPRRGIGALAEAMARRVGRRVELGRAPRAVDWRRRRLALEGEEVGYRRLVSTAPLDALGRLLVDPPAEVRDAFARLACTSLYYLDVALDAPAGHDWHWAYVPEGRLPFYRVGVYSHFSPAMAPPGKASLYVELAGREPPGEAAVAGAIAGLVEMGLVRRAGDVRFARVRRLEHAYVLFDRRRRGALDVILPFLSEHGIEPAGRYGSWTYASMEDALASGRAAARAALAGGGGGP
ncbi:MAG TPA: FAD-dependent oxidoreductase [Polyangiaceae bacterium]|nr:FAD-dependent oxidoreductase [Polyangiaceae bacterium]